jgi:hypothetical protein
MKYYIEINPGDEHNYAKQRSHRPDEWQLEGYWKLIPVQPEPQQRPDYDRQTVLEEKYIPTGNYVRIDPDNSIYPKTEGEFFHSGIDPSMINRIRAEGYYPSAEQREKYSPKQDKFITYGTQESDYAPLSESLYQKCQRAMALNGINRFDAMVESYLSPPPNPEPLQPRTEDELMLKTDRGFISIKELAEEMGRLNRNDAVEFPGR